MDVSCSQSLEVCPKALGDPSAELFALSCLVLLSFSKEKVMTVFEMKTQADNWKILTIDLELK